MQIIIYEDKGDNAHQKKQIKNIKRRLEYCFALTKGKNKLKTINEMIDVYLFVKVKDRRND